jgi:hypothetical protein
VLVLVVQQVRQQEPQEAVAFQVAYTVHLGGPVLR